MPLWNQLSSHARHRTAMITQSRTRASRLLPMPLFETIASVFQAPVAASMRGAAISSSADISQRVQSDAKPALPTVQINMEPDGLCQMNLINKDGSKAGTFTCGGQMGRSYPKSSIFNPARPGAKKKMVLSREFNNAEMPYSLRIWDEKGIYIHEWPNYSLSHGCIHLLPGDAKKVFDWVNGPTYINFNYPKSFDKMAKVTPEKNPFVKLPEFINIDDRSSCNRTVPGPDGSKLCISSM